MNSKERAKLKGLAMNINPTFQVGKNSITPEFTKAIAESFNNNEIIKISVLQNCDDDPKEMAAIIADRTKSEVVQVIGKKIILYKEDKEKKKKELLKLKKEKELLKAKGKRN